MEISWYGQNCFLIKTKAGVILTDPVEKTPTLKADLVTYSERDQENKIDPKQIEGNFNDKFQIFDLPGEYEVNNISVLGVPVTEPESKLPKVIFTYQVEGLKLGHLGSLNSALSDEQLELINGIDILFVPIGGEKALNTKKALEVISQIDPRVVIPMGFPSSESNAADNPVTVFAKEEGISLDDQKDVLKISAKDLPTDEQDIFILKDLS